MHVACTLTCGLAEAGATALADVQVVQERLAHHALYVHAVQL